MRRLDGGTHGRALEPGSSPPLRRAREGRVLGGVAAGVAGRLGVDPLIVRLGFVAATIWAGGIGALAYLILWAVVPEAESIEDILAGRLERGEISGQEYRDILADVSSGRRRR